MTKPWLLFGIAVLASAVAVELLNSPMASAGNIHQCTDDQYTRWPNQTATYDRSHGNFPPWWQNEIDEAADIWNDQHGANFSFHHYTGSSHDWEKKTDWYEDDPAWAVWEWVAEDDCRMVDADSWFNTRYTFSDCDDCERDEWDVRHVAAHEFSHWISLTHTWFRVTCVSSPKRSNDYTLCQHEKDHTQDIYGED